MPKCSTTAGCSSGSTRLGKPRAALVVYRKRRGQTRLLLVSTASDPSKLTLPGGKIAGNESAERAAMRETAEEAGVLTDAPRRLGRYLHRKQGGRIHPTRVFVARFAGTLAESEGRSLRWVTIDELHGSKLPLRRALRRQLIAAHAVLTDRRVAA